jgi:organic radical activating enzyme
MEIKITEHCNLRCSVCCDFGNIAEPEEYGLETFESDMAQLAALGIRVKKLRLLGGEPLLSKQINNYIDLTRRYQPEADLHLVTNGILLWRMPDDFFETARRNRITVQISNYPEEKNQPLIAKSKARLEAEAVNQIEYKPVCFEIDYIFDQVDADIEKIFKRCSLIYNSVNLYRGRIYKCPRPINLRHYDKLYGTSASDLSDGIDLFDPGLTPSLVAQRLDQPIRTCRYCTLYRGYVEWGQAAPDPASWINRPDNRLLIENYDPKSEILHRALDKFEYLIIEHHKDELSCRIIQMGSILEDCGHTFLLWLIDKYSIERFHFFKRVLQKLGKPIAGYIIDNPDFMCWLDEEEQGHVVDKSIVQQLDPSITLLFSTDERLTLRSLSSVIRKEKPRSKVL